MKDKLTNILLGVIVLVVVVNYLQSCGQEKKLENILRKQIDDKEQVSKQIGKIAKSRIDSVFIIERKIPVLIKDKERNQNEVYNTTNIDSVVKRLYYWRPDKIDSTD